MLKKSSLTCQTITRRAQRIPAPCFPLVLNLFVPFETFLIHIPPHNPSRHFRSILCYTDIPRFHILTMSAVMPESMALLLEKYSPEQIAEVIDAVMKMRPSASQSAVVASPTPVSAIIERKKRAKKSTSSKTAQTSARPSNSVAPTRPLNSWMAFRSMSTLK